MEKPIIKKSLFYIFPGLLIFFYALAAFSGENEGTRNIKKAIVKLNKAQQVKAVIPVPKNIVRANVKYQGGVFFTETRKDKIKRFRCSSCHNNKKVSIQNAAAIAHADIKVVHGGKDKPLSCYTCHSQEDRDFLVAGKESKIDLDHVYDMCGQCHFRQKRDWIGGAHGKRVAYWAGERVVKNCTSCHNPHSPRFEKRWPKTYSVPQK
ncbi:MAG: hypothetical protein GXP56_16450 [Deltaproteobacteria bacterium]|nr:hypothetical protein [Deltaproteobacteria bacterium]